MWAEIITKELEKHLGERIVLRLIPGARDIPVGKQVPNELRFNENTIVVSHGGNGVSFLQEDVDYNYAEYDSIGLMNLNIIAGKRIGDDMSAPASSRFRYGSTFAMTLMLCIPTNQLTNILHVSKRT